MKRRLVVVLIAVTVAAGAAGCAGAGGPAADTGTAPPSHALRVGLVEWRIVTSSTTVAAGVDHLTVTNAGTTAHNLYITGDGIHAHTANLRPGQAVTLTITTQPGTTLTLTCEVPGHEEAGMHTTVGAVDP